MKRYLSGVFAVAIAVACFAFTNNAQKNAAICGDPTDYWFQVPTSICTDVLQDAINAVGLTQNAIYVSPGVHFQGTEQTFLPSTANAQLCTDTDNKICAFSVAAADVTGPTNAKKLRSLSVTPKCIVYKNCQ